MAGQSLAAFKAAGLPAVDMSKFKSAVGAAAQAAKAAATGSLLMRLGKDGIWVYGPDNVEVQPGSQWAINPFSLSMGYAAWGEEKTPNEGTLMGEAMALITDVPVNGNELRDVGAPWNVQVQFDAVCLTGDDVGTLVRYKTTSTGGRRGFAGLVQEVSAQADGEDGTIVPTIEFASDSYQHKKWGKTYVPVFEIIEWRAPDDTDVGEDAGEPGDAAEAEAPAQQSTQRRRPAAAAVAPKAEPQTNRRAAAKAAATDVEEQPAPTGRRPAANSSKPAAPTGRAPVKGTEAKGDGSVDRGAVVRRRRRA